MNHTVTPDLVKTLHTKELEKHARDARDHGALELREAMLRATRTMVFAKLQEQLPAPAAEPGEDPDDTHARQPER